MSIKPIAAAEDPFQNNMNFSLATNVIWPQMTESHLSVVFSPFMLVHARVCVRLCVYVCLISCQRSLILLRHQLKYRIHADSGCV